MVNVSSLPAMLWESSTPKFKSRVWQDAQKRAKKYLDELPETPAEIFNEFPGVLISGSSNTNKELIAAQIFKVVANIVLLHCIGENYHQESHLCPFITGYNMIEMIERLEKINYSIDPASDQEITQYANEYFQRMPVMYISRLCELPGYYGRDWKTVGNILYNRYLRNQWTMITTDVTIDDMANIASPHTCSLLKQYYQIEVGD
jgi:hypothetical protein